MKRGFTILAVSTAILLSFALYAALVIAPTEQTMGNVQRIFYYHVPSAWVAFELFLINFVASVVYLIRRSAKADIVALVTAEVGVVFCTVVLITGPIWARPVWGIWWTWDARLVTTAVLFFLYLGYLALRRVPGAAQVRARRSAIVAIIAFADVPVVHLSVIWWRTLHQQPTVLNPELNPQIHGVMLATLLVGVAAFTVVYVHLLLRRYALARAENRREELLLEWAVSCDDVEADRMAVRP